MSSIKSYLTLGRDYYRTDKAGLIDSFNSKVEKTARLIHAGGRGLALLKKKHGGKGQWCWRPTEFRQPRRF